MIGKLLERIKRVPQPEEHTKFTPMVEAIEKHVKEVDRFIYSHTRLSLKECVSYEELKGLPEQDKIDALLFLVKRKNLLQQKSKRKNYQPQSDSYHIMTNLLDALMRTKFNFPADYSFRSLFEAFYSEQRIGKNNTALDNRPFSGLVNQIEKQVKKLGLTTELRDDVVFILADEYVKSHIGKTSVQSSWGPDIGKAVKKLQHLLAGEGDNKLIPPYELGSGKCGSLIKKDLDIISEEELGKWHALFHHLSSASAGKPTKKFITTANPLVDEIGASQFKLLVNKWLNEITALSVDSKVEVHSYNGKEHSYETYEYFEAYSNNLLKGLLWSMSRFHDKQSLQNIARLTEKCFQKIPGVGPAAAGVGNAGIYALAQSKGLGGISHLSRLKLRIRQNNTQKLIQNYIEEQAKKQGIKPAQIEEIAASDYGLIEGERTEAFDNYQLLLRVKGIGTTELVWLKPDGTPQKSVPAFIKNSTKLTDKLKKVRDISKQIKQVTTTQRDRIDRFYTEDMHWNFSDFEKRYLNHGLVSQVARKLIWTLDNQPAIFIQGQWQDDKGDLVIVSESAKVHLWHPIESEAHKVLAWRDRLEELQIQQPFKQAYREIYLLTDAEINTRIYSNRMAAHILKQHQFSSLAALRGWKYSLLGAYDDGRDGDIAQKKLPELNLTAEFWINEIIDDTESFNDAGIWHYVATDQVRFCDNNDQPVSMVDIPPLILSEIMRDVDLFVGVASVGNDPQWQDGGPDGRQDYRDYWHGYSFGDLTEVAKTRKTVLERLLPRLKIRDVAKIEGKFLIVQGKKNKYKIHIGSGNILIAPNDRYLCIVPSRGKDRNVDQLFLPFEGDNGLSIVLSKAFLLAADDKIEDATILSQL